MDSILKTASISALNTKTSLQLNRVAARGIVKTFFFLALEYKSRQGEREGTHCVCILVVVGTMGRRGKKHTCLQINWFGQEASKEELCVVKQACGEAGMSQQKNTTVTVGKIMMQCSRTNTHTAGDTRAHAAFTTAQCDGCIGEDSDWCLHKDGSIKVSQRP